MKFSRTSQFFIPLDGGLDTESSILNIEPGRYYAGTNHELADPVGMRRIVGYEVFDGRTKPSEAKYTCIEGDFVSSVNAGEVVTGASASGVVLQEYTGGSLFVYVTSGTFNVGDNILHGTTHIIDNVSSVIVGSGGVQTAPEMHDLNRLAGEVARTQIEEVPGPGDLIGAIKFNNKVFAFRGGNIFYSSPDGWAQLQIGQLIEFSSGNNPDGDVPPTETSITNGTSTATIVNIQIISGNWGSGTASGYFTIKDATGSFNNGDTLTIGTTTATAETENTDITRDQGKYLRAIVYNFTGSKDGLSLWGTDETNQPFKIDQNDNYIPIFTGYEDYTPKHIKAHHHHLFISYGSNWVHSGIGDPFKPWTLVSGADEWGMGDDIVGAAITPNGTMISFCENSIDVVYGSSSDDFVVNPFSSEYGAIENSVQVTVAPTYVGEHGMSIVQPTQKWGDFEINDIDRYIKTVVDGYKNHITASVVFRNKNEYRLYAGNSCIRMKFNEGLIRGFTTDTYDIPIKNINASTRDGVNDDEVFFTSDSGYVYQMDSGYSFNGKEIPAFLFLPPAHNGSARTRKRWYNSVFELSADWNTHLYVKHDFSLFHPYWKNGRSREITVLPEGGIFNKSKWNKAVFGGDGRDMFYAKTAGGISAGVGVMFYSNHWDAPYLIRSIMHRFSLRSEERW